jgi:endonuclease/exonuclease/phosphatase family metal-dependent hydrolase
MVLSYLSPFISPEQAWWISFFGLGYPIFMIFSLSFLFLFILSRSRRMISLGIILLLGTPLHIRYFSTGWSSDIENYPKQNSIRVMSYNVRLFDYYQWLADNRKTTRNAIYDHIKNVQPDVICFQEYLTVKNSNFIRERDISALGDYNYFNEEYMISKADRQIGVATYSKYPIIKTELVSFDNTQKQFATYTDIVKNNDTFRIYNIHLQSIRFQQDDFDFFNNQDGTSEEAANGIKRMIKKLKHAYPLRVAQAETILEHAKTSPFPTIICGDFNDTPMSYVYNSFNANFYDAFRGNYFGLGSTYAGRLPAGRIDYIFYSSDLKAINFSIQNEVHSDHYAITSEMVLK